MSRIILIVILVLLCSTRGFTTDYTWNGSVGNTWNNPANWTPSSGFPGPSDKITIVTSLQIPVLPSNVTVQELVINSGELNLSGFILHVTGNATVNSGGKISTGTLDFSGSGSSCTINSGAIVNASLTGSLENFYFNGATFNYPISLIKVGNLSPSTCAGGNIFNSTISITNNSSQNISLANSTGNVYNGAVSISLTNSGSIFPSYSGSNFFNNDIVLNSNSTSIDAAINFGTIGSATLANSKKISIGATGFTNGKLIICNFTDLDINSLSLELTGSASLSIVASSFKGSVLFKAPNIVELKQNIFNESAAFEKNGASTTALAYGGNIFHKAVTFRNAGLANYWRLGWGLADQFKEDLIIENSSVGFIGFSRNTATIVAGNLSVSCSSSGGIFFGEGLSLSQTTTVNGAIKVGASGFNSGFLTAYKLTHVSAVSQSLTFTGGYMQFFSSSFKAPLTLNAPQITVENCIFDEDVTYTKSGSANDSWNGGNTFKNNLVINNNGQGALTLSVVSGDTYNGDVTINNNLPIKNVFLASSGSSFFKGNILLTNSAGGDVSFGASGGTTTFEAGASKILQVSSFNKGSLILKNFTQSGAKSQQVTLGGTSSLTIGPSSNFDGDVVMEAYLHLLNGCTFNGTATLKKTGGNTDTGTGGNIFKKAVTLENSGTGYWRFASVNPEVFDTDIILKNTNTGYISMAYGATVTFNGDLYVNNTNAAGSIRFGEAGGTTNLKGKIYEHPNGFDGLLSLTRFNQLGNLANTLSLSKPSAYIQLYTCAFDGPWSMSAPRVYVYHSTFEDEASFTKTGALDDSWYGGNVFKKNAVYNNSGSGSIYLCSNEGDDIDGNLTLNRLGTGDMFPAYYAITKLAGSISFSGNQQMKFGMNGGELELDGGSDQAISGTASVSLSKLKLNKSSGKLIYKVPLSIANQLTFSSGIIETDNGSGILFQDNAIAIGMNDNSFVNGEVRKDGNDAFTFPVGAGGQYRAISISAPSATNYSYSARYIKSNPDPTYSNVALSGGLLDLSHVEYWTLNQNAGGSPGLTVTLSWNNDSNVIDPGALAVAQWNGSAWTNKGGVVSFPTVTSASQIATLPLASNPFTLGSTKLNALPIKLSYFRASAEKEMVNLQWGTEVEKNASKCVVEHSGDGIVFEPIGEILSAESNSINHKDYAFQDVTPLLGKNYYRLKFVDLDDSFEYSPVVLINRDGEILLEAYPVPSDNHQVQLRFNFEPTPKDRIVISDMMGKNLGVITSDQFGQPVRFEQTLSSGVYLLQYQGRFQKTIRIVLR